MRIVCNSNYNTHKFQRPACVLSRRSRFRPPINITLLTSSRLHSHLHPPLARPLSLSQISAMAPPVCPRADEESPPPRTLTRLAATRTPTRRLTRLRRTPQLWIGFGASTIFVCGSRCRRLRKPGKWRSRRRWRRRKPGTKRPVKPVMPPGKRRRWSFGAGALSCGEMYEHGYFMRKVHTH